MVNFRLKEEDVDRVDGAAERLSMSRSDFIRKAVSDAVIRYSGGGKVETVGTRGPAAPKTDKMKDSGCPNNSYCHFIKDTAGSRTCGTCGVKK